MNIPRLSFLDVYTCDPFANSQDVSISNVGFSKSLDDSPRLTITENPLNNYKKNDRYSTIKYDRYSTVATVKNDRYSIIQKHNNQQYDNELGRESISFLRRSPLIILNMIDKYFTGSIQSHNRKSIIGTKSTSNHLPKKTVTYTQSNHSLQSSNNTASLNSSISSSLQSSSIPKLGDSKDFKVSRLTFDLDSSYRSSSGLQQTTQPAVSTHRRPQSPRVKRVEDPIFEDWNWSSE